MSSEPERKYGQLPPEQEQQKLTKEALDRINSYAFYMFREFDTKNQDKGLEYAKKMLQEMTTNDLSPMHYYELYQSILSELSTLAEVTFQDTTLFSERRIAELYEELQYIQQIVPRLYMLFTVSPAFIKCGHAKANDVMRDLIEIARGVQHPTRALFLRHFMLRILKDVLPDEQIEGGTIEDTINFILENFKQMNVLWVRLEFSLDMKTVEERKLQRAQLKQLVGHNIQRIALLRGLDVEHYKALVLPFIIEQVKECRESLAQEYIIESIIHAFPVEFHIETINELFEMMQILEDDVNTLMFVTNIIYRLQEFQENQGNAAETVKIVAVQIYKLLNAGQTFAVNDTLEMLGNLLEFSLTVDEDNFDNVNSIMQLVEKHISTVSSNKCVESESVSRQLRYFLAKPIRKVKDASIFFELDDFADLASKMYYEDRKALAIEVSRGFARTETPIDTLDKIRDMFAIQQVLLKRPDDYKESTEVPVSLALKTFAKTFHLMCDKKSPDNTYELLLNVSSVIQELDSNVKEHLYHAFGEELLHLAMVISQSDSCEVKIRQVLQQIYILLTSNDPPELPSFWLFLEASLISDNYGTEAITTEFFTNALRIWKNSEMDSEYRFRSLLQMIKSASMLKNIPANTYSNLASELCSASNGLLVKAHEAEAHLCCAHLFNITKEHEPNDEEEDDESIFKSPLKVKNCLVRALKAATQMMDKKEQLPWYYRVLTSAVYFIEQGVELPMDWFNALTTQIDKDYDQLVELPESTKQFYANTIAHMKEVVKTE